MADLTQLERLFLHQNDIAQFPNILERIPSLRFLDLQVNRITTIPDEFFESCNLIRHLHLSDNVRLFPIPLVAHSHTQTQPLLYIPSAIQHCKQLVELALSRTSLEYLPVELHYIYKDKENMTQIALGASSLATMMHLDSDG
jgi:Leucine-rich repeat (LRR) protein